MRKKYWVTWHWDHHVFMILFMEMNQSCSCLCWKLSICSWLWISNHSGRFLYLKQGHSWVASNRLFSHILSWLHNQSLNLEHTWTWIKDPCFTFWHGGLGISSHQHIPAELQDAEGVAKICKKMHTYTICIICICIYIIFYFIISYYIIFIFIFIYYIYIYIILYYIIPMDPIAFLGSTWGMI